MTSAVIILYHVHTEIKIQESSKKNFINVGIHCI